MSHADEENVLSDVLANKWLASYPHFQSVRSAEPRRISMGPVESFLALIERLISLTQIHEQNRRDLFRNIVEPLFVELQPLVDDYFKLFADTRDIAEKTAASDMFHAVAEIRKRREAMLHLRRKTVVMAETVAAEVKDKKTSEFAKRVAGFFFCSQLEGPVPTSVEPQRRVPKSGPARLVELLDLVNREHIFKEEAMNELALTQKQLEDSWVAIAQSYAVLRLRALRP